jgi:hypothetical protein
MKPTYGTLAASQNRTARPSASFHRPPSGLEGCRRRDQGHGASPYSKGDLVGSDDRPPLNGEGSCPRISKRRQPAPPPTDFVEQAAPDHRLIDPDGVFCWNSNAEASILCLKAIDDRTIRPERFALGWLGGQMPRLKILISAYACSPHQGSESGIGWQAVTHMAVHHEVWVLTRANNRGPIEVALQNTPINGLHFEFLDLPRWARFWKRGQRGVEIYYYLWQIAAYVYARRLHSVVGFDLAHHYTFGRYWSPSFLSLLPIPFIWGPVGGGG